MPIKRVFRLFGWSFAHAPQGLNQPTLGYYFFSVSIGLYDLITKTYKEKEPSQSLCIEKKYSAFHCVCQMLPLDV